ncbi:MAG: FAD-dependent thymidylate synthase [Firmicutes bacterium]|nr:FAD-dependent thymidylate synthase [Bacillota bacterium]
MGTDLTPVNDARASYMKRSETLKDRDIRLLDFLAENEHTSPFRGGLVKLEIKAPLMVAREWFKYRIGSHHTVDTAQFLGVEIPEEFFWTGQGDDGGHGMMADPMQSRNEASRRYVTLPPEYYTPSWWRAKPAKGKQGSSGPVAEELQRKWAARWVERQEQSLRDFEEALADGIAAEQARLFLHAYGLYTVWRWTASIQAVAWFLHQRDDGKEPGAPEETPAPNPHGELAMWEIRQYARAVRKLVEPVFPHSLPRLLSFYNSATNGIKLPPDVTVGQIRDWIRDWPDDAPLRQAVPRRAGTSSAPGA